MSITARKMLSGAALIAISQAIFTIVSPAMAQEASSGAATADTSSTTDIVVTAQRRNESIRDVPVSITVFSGAEIERNRIRSLADYTAKAPNLGFTDNGSSVNRDFTIRGVSNLGGFTRSNAIYVDELNVTPGDVGSALEQNLVDVERIEVLRGPQGVFFGRNVIGGAVSITSRKPGNVFEVATAAEYSSYDTWLLRGMVNVPLVDDVLSMRVNSYWTKSNGYLKNISTGPDNSFKNWGLRGALRFRPTSNLTVDIAVQHNRLHSDNIDAVPTGEFNPTLTLIGLTSSVNSGEGYYPSNTSRLATDIPLVTSNRTTQVSGRLEWDFGPVSLIGVNGYIHNESTQIGDGDLTALNAYTDDNRTDLESYSTEWRIQNNGTGPFNWLVGIGYAEDKTSNFERRIFEPGVPGPFAAFVIGLRPINRDTLSSTKSLGIFANASYSFSDKLTVSFGGRYSTDKVYNYFLNRDFFTGAGTASQGAVTFRNFSPRFSAVFKVRSDVNIYATVSRGYKPGGFNFGSTSFPSIPRSFNAEDAWNYEAGVKAATANGVLQVNLSTFYLKWKNIQVAAQQNIFLGGGGFTALNFIQNAEGATSKGIELEATLRPVSGLTLSGGLGYNRARFGNFANAVDFDGLGSTTPDASSRTFDATGNTLPLAPEWTANAGVEYRHAFSDQLTGVFNFNYAYKSLQFTDTTNRRRDALSGATLIRTQIPAYSNTSLSVGLESKAWTGQLFINNILNDHYYIGTRGADGLAGTRVVVVPRTIGLRLSYKY